MIFDHWHCHYTGSLGTTHVQTTNTTPTQGFSGFRDFPKDDKISKCLNKIMIFRKKLHPWTHLDSCYFFHAYCYVVMSGSHWVRKFGINFIIGKKNRVKTSSQHSSPVKKSSATVVPGKSEEPSIDSGGHLRSSEVRPSYYLIKRESLPLLQSVQIQIYPVIVAMAI